MKQILHIFAKDSRCFWGEILISLALVTAFVWILPGGWIYGDSTHYAIAVGSPLAAFSEAGLLVGTLTLLIPVSWLLLIARVVHAESLVGDRQFWLTRPYERKKLLVAKALFLVVYLYFPILIAQCLLLVRAGFYPLSVVPGLFFNLFMITGILVLPLLSIATVSANLSRMILTLLGLLVSCITFFSLSSVFSRVSVSIPYSDHVSLPLFICLCGTVVVLQYTARRVWLSRLLLIALPILLLLGESAVPESALMRRAYPRADAAQRPPIQLTLLQDAAQPVTAFTSNDAKYVQVSIPLQVSGVADGYALIPNDVKATIEAADGSHWTSSWQAIYSQNYLPGAAQESSLSVLINRAFFDHVRSTPVIVHLSLALTQVRAAYARSVSLPTQDFSVPGFGICSPQGGWVNHQFFGIACRFALRQPRLTYISVLWSEGPCPASRPAQDTGIQGAAWAGNLDEDPADFGISSVSTAWLSLSNAEKIEDHHPEPRHLCPGTPVTFTQYNMVRRVQYDLALSNFHLPNYKLDGRESNGTLGIGFTSR